MSSCSCPGVDATVGLSDCCYRLRSSSAVEPALERPLPSPPPFPNLPMSPLLPLGFSTAVKRVCRACKTGVRLEPRDPRGPAPSHCCCWAPEGAVQSGRALGHRAPKVLPTLRHRCPSLSASLPATSDSRIRVRQVDEEVSRSWG